MKLFTFALLSIILIGCVTDSSDWSTGNITKSGDTLKVDTTRLRGPER
jgi:hypothetical protein